MTTTDRDARRRELNRLTKTRLIRICTAGVRTPDGGVQYIEGGMYPLSQWRKDEIVDSILRAECGPLPSETPSAAAGRDWRQMSAADFDAAKPLTLFAIEGGAVTPVKADEIGTPDLFAVPDPAADACLSCSRGDDGGGYPCDCPEACGARYCQHPTETASSDADGRS